MYLFIYFYLFILIFLFIIIIIFLIYYFYFLFTYLLLLLLLLLLSFVFLLLLIYFFTVPKLEFDGNKRKRKRCDITESGELINKSTPNPVDVPPDSLKRLGGVTARSLLPELDCALWVVDVDCLPLEAARLGYVAAEAGVCVQGHCDDEFQIAVNKHAWCFQVYSCGYHNSMCVCVVSRGTRLCDTPIGEFQPNTKLHISVGLLLDKKKSTLHVINVTTNSLIHSIPNIDTAAQLMPVFGVYNSHLFQVKLSVSSAMDLSLEPPLLMLLSSLV